MKNYIETTKDGVSVFSVLFFKDKKEFNETLESINIGNATGENAILKQRQVIFAGTTKEMMSKSNSIVEGSRVEFYDQQKTQNGQVTLTTGYPYYIIKPDTNPQDRYSVHKRHVNSLEMSTEKLAEMFITKVGENQYLHYELGIIKNPFKTYRTAFDSLKNLATKGKYIIMMKN